MFQFEKGRLIVPERPGLGVELDMAKVKRYVGLYGSLRKVSVTEHTPFKSDSGDFANILGNEP